MGQTKQIRAAVLGATGAVGQRYVSMLQNHPYITLSAVMGGESAGKAYGDAMRKIGSEPIPESVAKMIVLPSEPTSAAGCDIVFSALPSGKAREIERTFATEGFVLISKAAAYRMHPMVPLIVPEINPEHLDILKLQRKDQAWKGLIVTSPNCTVTGLSMVLKPIFDNFEVDNVVVNTMQGMSGDPNLSSLEMTNNIRPNIKDEEKKVLEEAMKIFGKFESGRIKLATMPLEIRCNRVPVMDGHMETLFIEFAKRTEPSEVISLLKNFSGVPQDLQLPSAPKQPIIVTEGDFRPQHSLDLMSGSVPGMSIAVGRVESARDEKSMWLTLLFHNRVRGATGNALLIAELMKSRRIIG